MNILIITGDDIPLLSLDHKTQHRVLALDLLLALLGLMVTFFPAVANMLSSKSSCCIDPAYVSYGTLDCSDSLYMGRNNC